MRLLAYLGGMETHDARVRYPKAILVVSLPMRDGNPDKTAQGFCFCLVVSLPMRDGNLSIMLSDRFETELLAYL